MAEFKPCREDAAEIAESYCLGLLSEADATRFEDHYLGCPACAALVHDADQFTRAMRAAAFQLNTGAPPKPAGGAR